MRRRLLVAAVVLALVPAATAAISFAVDARANVTSDKVPDRGTLVASISSGKYNAFGVVDRFPSGKLIIVYREGKRHIAAGDYGVIKMRTSTDQGSTWSAPTTIDAVANRDLRDVGGGVTASGRIVIFYGVYNVDAYFSGTGHFPVSLGYRYSDDEGATWSSYTRFSFGANTTTNSTYGNMIEIGDGKLMKNWYGYSPTSYSEYVLFSTDNGASWGRQVQVVTSTTVQWDEASYAYLGGGRIVALARISNGTKFKQLFSDDNGATWSNQGDVNIDSWKASAPPWLTTYRKPSGEREVALYYYNRDASSLRVAYATANDLLASGVSAWGAYTVLTSGWGRDAGYQTVVHPDGDERAYGCFYGALSSTRADLKCFTTSGVQQRPQAGPTK